MIFSSRAMGAPQYICALVTALCLLSPGLATALDHYDLRLASALADAGRNEVILHVSDCTAVASVTLTSGATSSTVTAQEAKRANDGSTACEFSALVDNAQVLDVVATIERGDDSSDTYAESFVFERNRPGIELEGVGIQTVADSQQVVVTLAVSDDGDIRYVDASASALRASSLRASNGIVERAIDNAFAQSDGIVRLFPERDEQSSFRLVLPVGESLSDAEILRNGVVLIDATVVDSSGNTASLSTISFTGESVSESVLGMQVLPEKLVFTDLLESAVIIPQVNYEFRGETALAGAGQGVRYTSSHPDIISVAADGSVYPLRDAKGVEVSISVEYAELEPVIVSVNMDFARTPVNLRAETGDTWTLSALNRFFDLPVFYVVFDDGSEKALTRATDVTLTVPESAASLLGLDESNRVQASSAIDSAIELGVSLRVDPGVQSVLLIKAVDAPPEIVVKSPLVAAVGENVVLAAVAADDIRIDRVVFEVDGSSISEVSAPPYEVSMTVPDNYLNRELLITATAFDSAGQRSQSDPVMLRVQAQRQTSVPALSWVVPQPLVRVVEGGELLVQLERSFKPAEGMSVITHVDILMDDRRVQSIHFPVVEQRKTGAEDQYFEVWKTRLAVTSISLKQMSQGLHAVVYAGAVSERMPDRVITIVADEPPSVQILSPEDGVSVAVGAELPVRVQFSDDAIDQSLTLELLVNGEIEQTFNASEVQSELERGNSAGAITDDHVFRYTPAAEQLGRTLEIMVRAIDRSDQISETDPILIAVRGDQAPQVSMSFPTVGTQLVAGVPVELRAEASDDVALKMVEFYVDSRLVGADNTRPYSFEYKPLDNVPSPQAITLWEVARDDRGQSTQSGR